MAKKETVPEGRRLTIDEFLPEIKGRNELKGAFRKISTGVATREEWLSRFEQFANSPA